MAKLKIKKGDTVRVITGKDKGKEGKVLAVNPKTSRIIVEGVNMATKHQRQQQTQAGQTGGIVHQEAPIHVSNVMYVYNGQPTRIGVTKEVVTKNGKSVTVTHRVAKAANNAVID